MNLKEIKANVDKTREDYNVSVSEGDFINPKMDNHIDALNQYIEALEQSFKAIQDLIIDYGFVDGSHHKQYALNKTLKITMTEKEYQEFLEENPDWEKGIAP